MIRIRKDKKNKIVIANTTIANFAFGGMSTRKTLDQTIQRIIARYQIYRNNAMSRFYILDCIAVELAKYIRA
jgi:hypothetical protein